MVASSPGNIARKKRYDNTSGRTRPGLYAFYNNIQDKAINHSRINADGGRVRLPIEDLRNNILSAGKKRKTVA